MTDLGDLDVARKNVHIVMTYSETVRIPRIHPGVRRATESVRAALYAESATSTSRALYSTACLLEKFNCTYQWPTQTFDEPSKVLLKSLYSFLVSPPFLKTRIQQRVDDEPELFLRRFEAIDRNALDAHAILNTPGIRVSRAVGTTPSLHELLSFSIVADLFLELEAIPDGLVIARSIATPAWITSRSIDPGISYDSLERTRHVCGLIASVSSIMSSELAAS